MARTLPDLDQPRYAEWARVSLGVKALVVGLNIFIQGLGKIDAKLVYDDAAYQALSSEARSTLEVMLRLTDTYTLSQLWVLGAYEATRTIDECARIDPELREVSPGHSAACIRVDGYADAPVAEARP